MGLRRIHRLLGLLIALPCLLWALSGALLAWKNGVDPRPPGNPAAVAGERAPFAISVDEAVRAAGRKGPPARAEWRWLLGAPRYHLVYGEEVVVVDGRSGQVLPPIDETLARRVAEADAAPGVRALSVALVTRPGLVYRPGRPLPALRVELSDGHDVYVSRVTGQVEVHADTLYRVLRVAFFALHLWDLSIGPRPHRSFFALGAAALLLFALGISGLVLALRPRARGTGSTPPRS